MKDFPVCAKYNREVLTRSTEKASLERSLKYQDKTKKIFKENYR